MTRGQRGWLALRCQRLALFHTVPVCPGTPERLASPQQYSGPLMAARHGWLHEQFAAHTVAPNSRLGKAMRDLQTR
jgi:hypothetical protein